MVIKHEITWGNLISIATMLIGICGLLIQARFTEFSITNQTGAEGAALVKWREDQSNATENISNRIDEIVHSIARLSDRIDALNATDQTVGNRISVLENQSESLKQALSQIDGAEIKK